MSAFTGRFWFELSETELQKYNFVIDDPTIWPDVVEELPAGVKLVAIVHRYEYRTKKLRCVHCSKTLHYYGAIVLLSNGRFARVGSSCGPELFPDEWKQAENSFEQARNITETRRRLDELAERIPPALARLRYLRAPAKEMERVIGSLTSIMGHTHYLKLRSEAARNAGALLVEKAVDRDVADIFESAQRGRKRQSDDENSKDEAYNIETFHIVRGRDFLEQISPEKLLASAIDDLEAAARYLANDNFVSKKKAIRSCNEAKEALERFAAAYRGMFRFFEAENLQKVFQWFAHERQPMWIARGSSILLFNSDGDLIKQASLNSNGVVPELVVVSLIENLSL